MGKKYLIVLDIDGTLVDAHCRSTSPTIYSAIEQMQKEGHLFVINSNRALEDILPIADHFGIKGYIIGENGCFIYNQATDTNQVLASSEIIEQVQLIKQTLPTLITQHFPLATFTIGDTTDLNQHLDTQDLPHDIAQHFIMNEYRKYSLSIHVRKVVADNLVLDAETTQTLCNVLKKYLNEQSLKLFAMYTNAYANVLVCSQENNKTKAFKVLTDQLPQTFTKVIIGDDLIDKPALNEINYFFVVNNATDNVKSVAHYVSHEKITKGVEEILLKIDSLTK